MGNVSPEQMVSIFESVNPYLGPLKYVITFWGWGTSDFVWKGLVVDLEWARNGS